MVAFCGDVLDYTEGFNSTSFDKNQMRYDAILRKLELIGEAATHVPDDVRQSAPDVPWRLVVALRNRLIHGYLGVDADTIWSIVRDDVKPVWSKHPWLCDALNQRGLLIAPKLKELGVAEPLLHAWRLKVQVTA